MARPSFLKLASVVFVAFAFVSSACIVEQLADDVDNNQFLSDFFIPKEFLKVFQAYAMQKVMTMFGGGGGPGGEGGPPRVAPPPPQDAF